MKKQLFFAALAATLALTSCGGEDSGMQTPGGDAPRFSAAIGAPQSRAFNTTWESGDAIGISCLTGGKAYTNVAYSTTGDGNFDVVADGTEIYYQDESEVTFTGYHPYAADTDGYGADTRNQAEQKRFDFLWAQASGKKASPQVAFTFAHRMTRVVLTLKPGNGVGYDEVKTALLSLEGLRHTGTFNVTDGSTSADGATTDAWRFAGNEDAACNAPATPDDANGTVTFTLLFFPQELDAPLSFFAELAGGQLLKAGMDFTAANREKDGEAAKNEWVAGRQYSLTVTLHKTAITLDNCSIMPWNEVDGGNIDAEQ